MRRIFLSKKTILFLTRGFFLNENDDFVLNERNDFFLNENADFVLAICQTRFSLPVANCVFLFASLFIQLHLTQYLSQKHAVQTFTLQSTLTW